MEQTAPGGAFNNFSDIFDASINWPRRLAHEGPFHRRIFERHRVQSVLDAACGPGHHAAMFHGWGLRVQGADLSPAMIARAAARFGAPPGLDWVVRGYDQAVPETFDAAICVGNSLALAPDLPCVARAIQALLASVGRVLVIHLANVWAWPDGPCLWQKCFRTNLPDGPAQIIKGVHRAGTRAFIELLAISAQDPPQLRSDAVPLLALEAADLERTLRRAGAADIALFGGYTGEPYARAASTDLILVAAK